MTFERLLDVCKSLAQQPLLAQGAGANVSIKLAPNDMRIKASGFSFDEITAEKGLVSVDPQRIAAFYTHLPQNEDEAAFQLLAGTPRPSMETGFHAFLDRVVIHTHPVQTNIIACLKDGERLTRELYGDHVHWIPYVTPGHPLAKEIFKLTTHLRNEHKPVPNAFMLQNHGLIVSGPTVDFCWQWHQRMIAQAETFLQSQLNRVPQWPSITFAQQEQFWMASNPAFSRIVDHPLQVNELVTNHPFPDSVVFLDDAHLASSIPDASLANAPLAFVRGKGLAYRSSERRAREFEDVVTASLLIREFGERLGGVRYLDHADVRAIRESAFEKHRQQVKK